MKSVCGGRIYSLHVDATVVLARYVLCVCVCVCVCARVRVCVELWDVFRITNSCIWNICVTWQGIDYKLPEDDTIVSKHVGVWQLVK